MQELIAQFFVPVVFFVTKKKQKPSPLLERKLEFKLLLTLRRKQIYEQKL